MPEKNFFKQLSLLTFTLLLLISAIGLASRISPEKSRLNLTGRAFTEPTDNTGSYIIPHSPQQLVIEHQSSALLHAVPISGNNFVISFDYYRDVFQITLYPPFETSKANFFSYLQQNGYSQLPKDMFEYLVNPTVPSTPTPIPVEKPGDANGDGKVDDLDYAIWANNYGITNTTGLMQGDFNNDHRVDDLDYTIWANNYGK